MRPGGRILSLSIARLPIFISGPVTSKYGFFNSSETPSCKQLRKPSLANVRFSTCRRYFAPGIRVVRDHFDDRVHPGGSAFRKRTYGNVFFSRLEFRDLIHNGPERIRNQRSLEIFPLNNLRQSNPVLDQHEVPTVKQQ